ncbi:putative serine protease PepD [Streptomyces sp. BK208]|uniref:S1C family serine protease n=1 Tax=Streptomyces sp. BK208 TaxID=2512150 RepID=UPI0010D7E42C|nr:trypsin-like peptidase domain-containing protein [Streptomyces sp. BK208]TDT38172.1 putative serine protease PepD [Streptomyces sp. BK208]
MNEGKPTRAKWWSRPRSSEGTPDGDFELERPRPAPTAGTGTATEAHGTDGGGFEPARPPAPRATDQGDYELDLPRPAQDRPADVVGTPPHPRPVADADTAPTVDAGAEPPRGTAPPAGSTPAADPAPPAGPAPVAERPKPLHEPDPYSTPPYGEPGPWAPAPPVQHPAATPAHGTVTEAATPAPTTPAPGVPAPAPQAPAVPAPAPAPAPPAPAGASSVSPPPHAGPVPAFAEVPAPVAPTAPAPAAPAAGPDAVPAAPATAVPPPSGPSSAAAADPWAGPPAPAPGAEPGADPWGRYDPWAASAAQYREAPDRTPRRRRTTRTLVGGALLIALVSGGIGGGVGAYLERNGGVGTVELPQAAPEAAERAPDSVAGIAARALPSVVTLHVSGSEAAGTGTGFVLDDRGHILTNNHVVEPAGSGGEITVTFNSGDTAEATVVGRDSGYDLAVVKVKGVSGLTPMPLGNSESVRVGDPVVAIGAPFDLAGTVTSGIISAKERPITAGGEESDGSDVSYVDALQTDAPINPGNSGGPLLDARGRAIGINSAIRSADSGSADADGGQAGSIGLGFAIPINQGKRVAEELINTGKAAHPVIGVTLDMGYTGDGARVGAKGGDGGPAVTAGGPGAKAGIEPGDVITAVDGQRVHSGEELIVKTRAHRPGDRLELTLERDGKERKVSLVLGSAGGD